MLVDTGPGRLAVIDTTGYVLLLFQCPVQSNCSTNMLKCRVYIAIEGCCMRYVVKQFRRLWKA